MCYRLGFLLFLPISGLTIFLVAVLNFSVSTTGPTLRIRTRCCSLRRSGEWQEYADVALINTRAESIRGDWAGRFWYSFYERGINMEGFTRHALAYITGVAPETLNGFGCPTGAGGCLGAEGSLTCWCLMVGTRSWRTTGLTRRRCRMTRPTRRRIRSAAAIPAMRSTLRTMLFFALGVAFKRLSSRLTLHYQRQPPVQVCVVFLGGLRPPDEQICAQGVSGDGEEMRAISLPTATVTRW